MIIRNNMQQRQHSSSLKRKQSMQHIATRKIIIITTFSTYHSAVSNTEGKPHPITPQTLHVITLHLTCRQQLAVVGRLTP